MGVLAAKFYRGTQRPVPFLVLMLTPLFAPADIMASGLLVYFKHLNGAIEALGEIGEKGAVKPLIDRIGEEEGRLKDDCAKALTKLTGQMFGQADGLWRNKVFNFKT